MYDEFNQYTNEPALATLEKLDDMLEVWHARLAYSGLLSHQMYGGKGAVRDLDATKCSILADCSPCIQGTMRNSLVKTRKHVEMVPRVMVHTNVVVTHYSGSF